jgi:hypothetical protein
MINVTSVTALLFPHMINVTSVTAGLLFPHMINVTPVTALLFPHMINVTAQADVHMVRGIKNTTWWGRGKNKERGRTQ